MAKQKTGGAVRKTRKFIPHVQFVRKFVEIVHSGGTTAQVAQALGLSVNSVHARASDMRKKGVTLPKPAGSRPGRIDARELNDIVNEVMANGQ
jgi:transposase